MINMNLRNLQESIYDIEDAFLRKDENDVKESITTALKALDVLKKDFYSRDKQLVELEDVYAFLKDKRDENDSPVTQALLGKDIAQKKWYYVENIIESMEVVFGTVK